MTRPARSTLTVAKELDAKIHEWDSETDPQRLAVLEGERADLHRELRRAARQAADEADRRDRRG